MKQLILALLLASQAFSQFPQISVGGPARPSMQVGSTLTNIGTSTAYTSAGAPGVIATSVVGDIDIDTTDKVVYICTAGNAPCTTWQFTAPPVTIPVTAFGVNGTASTDPGNFSTAVSTMTGIGCVYIPAGTTVNLSTQVIAQLLLSGACIKGDGPGSVIQAGTSLGAGSGVLETSAGTSNIELGGFAIQGACTSATPPGMTYTAAGVAGVNSNTFTTNSSIYLFGNVSNVRIHDLTINHTCGYSIYADTTSGNILNVSIQRVNVTNSRPFLFGTSSSYEVYGSWIGGMLFYGPGTTYSYQNLTVDNCTFQNVVGNALWTHVGTISLLSQNVAFTNNTCIDTGLDCIQAAGIDGYTETGNRSYRNGYVILSDIGGSRTGGPAWVQTETPVSFDTSGEVINAIRSNNIADTENGEGFDGDGLGMAVVRGNTVTSCFSSADPLASATSCGPYNNPSSPVCPGGGSCTGSGLGQNNFVRGMTTGNSTGITTKVGQNLIIQGNNFIGVGGGGVQAYGINNSIISGNVITQPTNSSYSDPITLGNLGTNAWQHANGNLVTANTAIWSPTSGAPMVFQDGATYAPFFTGDLNYVRSNVFIGTNLYEFQKCNGSGGCGTADPSTSGTGQLMLSSVTPGADSVTAIVLQTEGTTANPVLAAYLNNGSGTNILRLNSGGALINPVVFASLPLASAYPNFVIAVTGVTIGSNPCSSGSGVSLAISNGSSWRCF